MPKTKTTKPQKHRYVVEVLVETDRKWFKMDMKRWVVEALEIDTFDGSGIINVRVRKVDMD